MPHILLEYSENLDLPLNDRDLFLQIHQVLNRLTGIRLENCKSRAVKQLHSYIADGDPQHAFVHLDVRFLEGRPEDLKEKTGKTLLEVLKAHFGDTATDKKIQITVEIRDIPKKSYFKHPDNL